MIELRLIESDALDEAIEVMHDALPIRERLVHIIRLPEMITYGAYEGDKLVGAAIVAWGEQSEIEVLAVAREKRRQGLGQAFVALLIDEARQRGHRTLLVATASISLDNIMFYQKCGFRMSAVRRGFFDQHFPNLTIHHEGVRVRDMIVFDYEL